jgi:4-amino-4-deoxy-L-arabinose transferase-like glycosyltransferase
VAVAAPRRRRLALPKWAGDARVWAVAGAAGAVVFVALLVYCVVPRDYYTGTNSLTTRSVAADLKSGQRLCVRGLTLPAGTGQVRFNGGAIANPARTIDVEVVTAGRTLRGSFPGSRLLGPGNVGTIDVPIGHVASTAPAQVCITPRGGQAWVGGILGLEGNDVAPSLDGKPFPNRIAMWFLPPAGEQKSLLSRAPQIMHRAALFRPGVIGTWTYWLLFFVALPALAFSAVLLLARAAADLPARLPRALAIFLIGFACAASFAIVTPLFETPDEGEHFAAVQYLAETGHAVDRSPGERPLTYSTEEGFGLEALNLFGIIENAGGRPPWREADEQAWLARVRSVPGGPKRNDGGGFAVATSAHSPLYYTLVAPGYLATRGASLASQLTAVRLMSSLLGALVVLFAFLIVRELLPRQPWAAVAAGLVVAFQPMFGFISGAVNNDNGVNAAVAAIAYLLIRGLRRGLTLPVAGALGAALAVAPILKGTGYFVYPVAALALLGMLLRGRDRRTLLAVGGVVASLVIVTGLWAVIAPVFGRTLVTAPGGNDATAGVLAAHDPIGYAKYVWQLFFPPIPGTGMTNIYAQRVPAFSIYIVRGWGAFGWYAILFPNWLFVLIGIVVAGFGVLGIATLARFPAAARSRLWEILVLLAIPVCVFLGVESVYASVTPRPGPVAEQGRYIFPAITALAALAVGACFAFGRRLAVPLTTLMVVGMIGLSLYGRILDLTGFFA